MVSESPFFPAAVVLALPSIIQFLPDHFQIVPRGFQLPENRQPIFADYLSLAFNTSATFIGV
jgi:hypothetical protein